MLLLIFSIAMGILEAIVVVYLRKIFYSTGFKFPLKLIPGPILKVEILREFCTIIMLVSIALIAGRNKLQSFSYFLFCFAVWDISYYVGLKMILGWPPSLFTWDVLFLIPFPWIGPVLAPLISSFTMIVLSLLFLFMLNRNKNFKVKIAEWIFICLGTAFIFISFMWAYASIIISDNLLKSILTFKHQNLDNITLNFSPTSYHWIIFTLGILSIYFSIFLILKRYVSAQEETR